MSEALAKHVGEPYIESMNGYITEAQSRYLARLLNEAFANGARLGSGLDSHHLSETTKKAAAFAIERIKACKANGWKPLVSDDDFWFWRGFQR